MGIIAKVQPAFRPSRPAWQGGGGSAPEEEDLLTFAQALTRADAGNVAMFQHQVVIDNDAIKASPTTLPVILPTYTEDCVVGILHAVAVSNITSAYTNGGTIIEVVLGWDDDNYDAAVPFFNPGVASLWNLFDSSGYCQVPTGPLYVAGGNFVNATQGNAPIASIKNKNLALYVDNGAGGNLTGGHANNTLTITVIGVCVPV